MTQNEDNLCTKYFLQRNKCPQVSLHKIATQKAVQRCLSKVHNVVNELLVLNFTEYFPATYLACDLSVAPQFPQLFS